MKGLDLNEAMKIKLPVQCFHITDPFKSQMLDSRPKTDDEHTAQIRTTSQGSLWYLEFGWGKENALISHHFILDTQFDENQ